MHNKDPDTAPTARIPKGASYWLPLRLLCGIVLCGRALSLPSTVLDSDPSRFRFGEGGEPVQ